MKNISYTINQTVKGSTLIAESVTISNNDQSIRLAISDLFRFTQVVSEFCSTISASWCKDGHLPAIDRHRQYSTGYHVTGLGEVDLRDLLAVLRKAKDEISGSSNGVVRPDMSTYTVTPVDPEKDFVGLMDGLAKQTFVGRFESLEKAIEYYVRKVYRDRGHLSLKIDGNHVVSKVGDRYLITKNEKAEKLALASSLPDQDDETSQ